MSKVRRAFFYVPVAGVLIALLSACSFGKPEYLGGDLNGVNHTSAGINYFLVNGYGGPNISPHGYGGGYCCVMLPRIWTPGLKVLVEWEVDPDPYEKIPRLTRGVGFEPEALARHEDKYRRFRREVDLPAYLPQDLCSLKVHFLSCDRVDVTTACMAYGQPGYPIKEPIKSVEKFVCPN